MVEVVGLLAPPAHRYDGLPATTAPGRDVDRREFLEIRAGFGVVGDRYAGRPAHRDASMTVIAAEPLDALAAELGPTPFDPLLTRRNVVLRGADVESLRGRMRGRGRVRCAPETGGLLRLGPALLRTAHRPALGRVRAE